MRVFIYFLNNWPSWSIKSEKVWVRLRATIKCNLRVFHLRCCLLRWLLFQSSYQRTFKEPSQIEGRREEKDRLLQKTRQEGDWDTLQDLQRRSLPSVCDQRTLGTRSRYPDLDRFEPIERSLERNDIRRIDMLLITVTWNMIRQVGLTGIPLAVLFAVDGQIQSLKASSFIP